MNKKIILIVPILISFSLVFALSLQDISSGSSSITDFFSSVFKKFFGSSTDVTLSCDDCAINSCSCSISNCQSGILEVYKQSECSSTPSYIYTFSGNEKTWFPESEGKYFLKVSCDDGKESSCTEVGIGDTTSTTQSQDKLRVSSVHCNKNQCTLDIDTNSLDDELVIFFELVDDEGRRYYSSNLNLESRSVGKKKLVISRVRTCPEGTKLRLFVLIYKQSDLDYRIDRISDEAFEC